MRIERWRYLCWLTGILAMTGAPSCSKKLINDPVADSVYLGRLSFVINNNSTFTDYYSALQQTGWLDTLAEPGPFTVVLPNNDAYGQGYNPQFGQGGNLSNFIASEVTGTLSLSTWVSYNLIRGAISFRSMPLGVNQPVATLTGQPLYVTRYLSGSGQDTMTTVNGQPVISADNPATNGLIQVASGVPNLQQYSTVMEQIKNDTNLVYFAAALQRAHLDTLLMGQGPFTVLAPVNNAFLFQANFSGVKMSVNLGSLDSIVVADPDSLRAILQYFILPGRYFINDFMRQLPAPGDTVQVTMLNGGVVKFTTTGDYGYGYFPESYAAPVFFGNGNLEDNLPGGIIADEQFYTTVGAMRNAGDLPAGNGVVQTLRFFLVP